jgi:hypothetical protein
MNLKLSKIITSALAAGLLVLSGHAVAGPNIGLCDSMRSAAGAAISGGLYDIASEIAADMDAMDCPVMPVPVEPIFFSK